MTQLLQGLGWQALLQTMAEAVWLIDEATLEIVHVNPAAERLAGQTAAQMLGMSVHQLAATPQDLYRWSEPSDWRSEVVTHTKVLRPDGALVPVQQRIHRLQGEPGRGLLMLAMLDRSEQEASEAELEALLNELRATLDSAADGMLVCDDQANIRAFNHRMAELWQMPPGMLVQRNDAAVLQHICEQLQAPEAYRQQWEALRSRPLEESRDVLELQDGRMIERRSVPLLRKGVAAGRIFSFRDITREAQVQADLRLAAQVFDCSLDAIFIADHQARVIKVNPACERMLGHSVALGLPVEELFEQADGADWAEDVRLGWLKQGFWEGRQAMRRVDQPPCVVRVSWVALRNAQGEVFQSIGFVRDLTQQQAAQQRIEQLAFSDALTGLPNRLLLSQHVEQVISAGEKAGPFAILFLDLDRFKIINDSLGHAFGDRVLQLVAQRLQSCLRPKDILCRLGGDEFVLYLHECSREHSGGVAKRILAEMLKPFLLDGMGFSVQCSIGVAHYPEHGTSLDELIKQADTAMYQVKESGRGSFGFYEPAMSVGLLDRMQLEHAMRQALPQGHMAVYYQPQVALETGRIVGAEALLRWSDPKLGDISPGQFIGLAEDSGYIVTLGAWVLDSAIQEAARWMAQGMPCKVSVNVSSLELRQAQFVSNLAQSLVRHHLPAQWLELELTETILLQQSPEMNDCIHQLAELGVSLVIDDFGTGYSNLAYLKQLPIAKLKVDQSFVRGLPDDDSDKAIVDAVIGLGRALQVQVVAEGVENEAQRQTLAGLACDYYQGFLCAPGMPAEQFRTMLQRQHEKQAV